MLKKILMWGSLALVAIVFPYAVSSYTLYLINLSGVYVILVIGLNYVFGFTGQISLAHAGFWGLGAYTSALLTTRFGFSFLGGLVISGLIGMAAGLLVGLPSLKLKGFYLAISTYAVGGIINLVLNNWSSVTRGADGIPGIPPPQIGSWVANTGMKKYYLMLVFVILVVVAFDRLKKSRIGRGLQALGDNEFAAESMGINTYVYKLIAFSASAICAAIAGSLFAHLIGYTSPDNFTSAESITLFCMLLLGGVRSTLGPVIGSVLLVLLPEFMRFLDEYCMLIYGICVVILAIWAPEGIMGFIGNRIARRQVAKNVMLSSQKSGVSECD
ncbi:MAG: branched-chain amino acid ABC transporter permease [Firmicutes bacterium]|nr:branched-chain amino acid ABC transporter permease [Bacillota bacterium]